MAKDFVTGKKTTFGNTRSHALNSSSRSWKPNLQKVRILVNGKPKRVYKNANFLKVRILVNGKPKRVWVSTKTLTSGKVTRV